MKLNGLIHLYKSMKSHGIERYKFDYKVGKVIFDVFFFIDGSPYLLLFGVKSENFSLELEVMNGFIIEHELEHHIYKRLCEILGLEFDPERKFSPWIFFSEFNGKIPQQAFPHQKAKPQDIAPYRGIAEDADKTYFVGWRDNHKWGTNVQQSNLDKTRDLLSEKAYQICKQKNISSCWTDKKEAAIEFTLPL